MRALGIDIGGTGVKGAIVDTEAGTLVTDRRRIKTPRPATPDAVSYVVGQISRHFDWDGPVGVTFPGVVKHETIHTAVNLDPSWVSHDAAELFTKTTGCPVHVLNDADAAGIAEARFGHPEASRGVVVLLTLGTGIGSALLLDGELVPNTELGHLKLGSRQVDAERRASEAARERDGLSWKKWGARLSHYLQALEALLWPDLFLLGGGVSASSEKYVSLLRCRTPVEPAQLLNQAGIIGAALASVPTAAP